MNNGADKMNDGVRVEGGSELFSKTFSGMPVIAISGGDPGGIGPEIICHALMQLQKNRKSSRSKKDFLPWDFIPVIIGDLCYFDRYLKPLEANVKTIKKFNLEEKQGALDVMLRSGAGVFLDMDSNFSNLVIGHPNEENALASYNYFRLAFELTEKKIAQGMVTGPVNKAMISKAGLNFVGHTEEFVKLANQNVDLYEEPYMMFYHEDICLLLLTTHLPMSEVSKKLNIPTAHRAIDKAIQFIQKIDGKKGNVAILGIDPHAGDQGAFGTIDQDFSIPLVTELKSHGIHTEGPFSADSFFSSGAYRNYTLVVAAYHDQGLIPFKMICFGKGVNVSLNLPIFRTSPDHGTAFEIAGKNCANPGSMAEAIKLCHQWLDKA